MEEKSHNKIKMIVIFCVILIIIAVYNIIGELKDRKNYSDLIVTSNEIEDESIEKNIAMEEVVKEEKNIIKVYVTGEVNIPGVVELEEGDRIEDAIQKAGGITENANLFHVNLAYPLEDGQKLYIPNKNESTNINSEYEDGIENTEENVKSINKKININKADVSELQKIPGVGPSMANKIILYREENGKYKTIEDLKNVSGIGDKTFEKMKEYIDVK